MAGALATAGFLVGVNDHCESAAEMVARQPIVGPDFGIGMHTAAVRKRDLAPASFTLPGRAQTIADLVQDAG